MEINLTSNESHIAKGSSQMVTEVVLQFERSTSAKWVEFKYVSSVMFKIKVCRSIVQGESTTTTHKS